MLKMFFGEMEEAYYSGSALFDNWVDCGVINTDFSKRVIKEIDWSEVVSPYLIMSPVLGAISYRMLSGGAKTLMCLCILILYLILQLWEIIVLSFYPKLLILRTLLYVLRC